MLRTSTRLNAEQLFSGMNGASMVMESRVFGDSPLDVTKCYRYATKLLCWIYCGGSEQNDVFISEVEKKEALTIFFSLTRIFQSRDMGLRRLTYIIIKELKRVVEDMVVITSSLIQDVNNSGMHPVHRADALRVLCTVIDDEMVPDIERFVRQCISSNDVRVSSAALVSCINMLHRNKTVVRKWELPDIPKQSELTRYHSLILMFLLKRADKMSILRLLQTNLHELGKYDDGLDHMLVLSLLLNMCVHLHAEGMKLPEIPWRSLLSGTGNRRIVSYEAARVLCELPIATDAELGQCVSIFRSLLESGPEIYKFAALRSLNRLAAKNPEIVSVCNPEVEHLVTSGNESVAILAMAVLLKTGDEISIDRLMIQINSYVCAMSIDLKKDVIATITSLALRFPSKKDFILGFISGQLANIGEIDYKQGLINSVDRIMSGICESRKQALDILCEFIEDCSFSDIAAQALYLISTYAMEVGIGEADAQTYVRYVYNRLLLEAASVRMEAIFTLVRLCSLLPNDRKMIRSLLSRHYKAEVDDVKDRVLLSSLFLDSHVERPCAMVALKSAEGRLVEYLESGVFKDRVSLDGLDRVDIDEPAAGFEEPCGGVFDTPVPAVDATHDLLKDIDPAIADILGRMVGTEQMELTDANSEYLVDCRKCIFENHIVFQYTCTNLLSDISLENMRIETVFPAPCQSLVEQVSFGQIMLSPGERKEILNVYRYDPRVGLVVGDIQNILTFSIGNEGTGFVEEYKLKDARLAIGDFVSGMEVKNAEEKLGAFPCRTKRVETLPPGIRGIGSAILYIQDMFGGEFHSVNRAGATVCSLYFFGRFLGEEEVAFRLRLAERSGRVSIEVLVGSMSQDICTLFISIFNFGL